MKKTTGVFAATMACMLFAGAQMAHAARRSGRRAGVVKGVANINEAPLSKLVLLPYVGRGKAKAIVRYRKAHRFSKPSDLVRVPGIGRKTFVKIKTHVTVSGPTTIRRVTSVSVRKGAGRRTSGKSSRARRRTRSSSKTRHDRR